jgi:hypothetical protein
MKSLASERSKPSAKKPSSFYMKQMRAGLAAAGYVKHETWVLPENRSLLKQMEPQAGNERIRRSPEAHRPGRRTDHR